MSWSANRLRAFVMARLRREAVPGLPHYLVQGVRDGETMFPRDPDRQKFLNILSSQALELGVSLHAYALLSSRVFLIATPSDSFGLSRLMQSIGRRYVPYFNRQYRRRGALWSGRYSSSVLEPEHYLLPAMVHLEAAPLRAHQADRPESFPWSSYLHNGGLEPGKLLSFHAEYWNLGNTPFEREQKYRQLFSAGTPPDVHDLIERSLSSGYAIGREAFAKKLEQKTGRRMLPRPPGRPKKRIPEHDAR